MVDTLRGQVHKGSVASKEKKGVQEGGHSSPPYLYLISTITQKHFVLGSICFLFPVVQKLGKNTGSQPDEDPSGPELFVPPPQHAAEAEMGLRKPACSLP